MAVFFCALRKATLFRVAFPEAATLRRHNFLDAAQAPGIADGRKTPCKHGTLGRHLNNAQWKPRIEPSRGIIDLPPR